MTKRIAFVTIVAAFALSLPCVSTWAQSSQQGQDSVAEAARKARAHKKAPAKPEKVITNDDLASVSSAQVSVVGQAGPKGAPGTGEDQTTGATGEKKPAESDEARWRKRFAEAYHKLHQAEAELNVLEREWGKLQTQYYSDPQKALQQQNSRADVNDHQQKIDAKKKEIEQIHQAIANLEDELRKSGGDPGWARP